MKSLFAILLVIVSAVNLVIGHDEYSADSFYEPCKNELNLNCLRKYFKENGMCNVVSEGNSNPKYEVRLPIYVPCINTTVVCTTTYPADFNGVIEKIVVDESTSTLLLSVNYEGLFAFAPQTILAVSQKGMEPAVVQANINVTYPTVLTAEIPIGKYGITVDSLKHATYSSFFKSNNAIVNIGPEFSDSSDPVISAAYDKLVKDLPLALKEIFLSKASYYFIVYIQNYLCDFGITPVLQYDFVPTVFDRILENKGNGSPSMSHPCDQSDDMDSCAKDFFSKNSGCSVVDQASDEPLHRPSYEVYTPAANSSMKVMDATVTGLDGKIMDFFINEDTNNLVVSVCFEGISIKSPKTALEIHQRGKQSKIVDTYTHEHFPVTLTAVIPMKDGINPWALRTAYVTPYFNEASDVKLEIGEKMSGDSSDPEVKEILKELKSNQLTQVKEIFIFEANRLFLAYLQKYICDFGVPFDAPH